MAPGIWTASIARERIEDLRREAEHERLIRWLRHGSKARHGGWVHRHGWWAASAPHASGGSPAYRGQARSSSRSEASGREYRELAGPLRDSAGRRPGRPLVAMVRRAANRPPGWRDAPVRHPARSAGPVRHPRQGARSRPFHHRGAPHSDPGRSRRARMRRVRVQRPKRKRERPWLEALTTEPRDPDIVRAKALGRSPVRTSRGDSGRRVSG
jgi:hypothetical protein